MHELVFQAGVIGMSERSELIPCIIILCRQRRAGVHCMRESQTNPIDTYRHQFKYDHDIQQMSNVVVNIHTTVQLYKENRPCLIMVVQLLQDCLSF